MGSGLPLIGLFAAEASKEAGEGLWTLLLETLDPADVLPVSGEVDGGGEGLHCIHDRMLRLELILDPLK